MNHFLALRPAAHVRDRLAEVAARLRAWELPARWVHPEDYHCTLCFLGHLDDDEARVLPRAVDEVAGSLEAPPLTLDGLGAFGGKRMPRTVFAALGDPEEALAGYHHDLAQAAEEPPERRFRPHLTLARPTGSGEPGRDWPDAFAAFGDADWGACPIEALVFCRRRPGRPQGPAYEILERWALIAGRPA